MWRCNDKISPLFSNTNLKSFDSFNLQINPTNFTSEDYYDVDGALTTKLEQVDISKQKKDLPKCSDDTAVIGKGGVHYLKHGAFCLETQKFPDAVHHVRSFDNNKFILFSLSIILLGQFSIYYLKSGTTLQP